MGGTDSIRKLSPYIKYPFTVSLNEYLRRFYEGRVPITYLVEHVKQEYVERAIARVRSALKNSKYVPSDSEEMELSAFYIGLILASVLGRWCLYKYADAEAKRSYEYLLGDSEENIVKVANIFGIQLDFLGSHLDMCGERVVVGYDVRTSKPVVHCLQFRVPITTYLTGVSKLTTEPKWKLVNQYVKGGYVYLGKRDVSRLLQEFIKHKLVESVPDLSGVRLEGRIGDVVNMLKEELPVKAAVGEESHTPPSKVANQVVEEAHPPCVKNIIEKLMRNENLAHHQRFALAVYMINIGADMEEIIDLFRHAPDFNEKLTRYQIEHLAGLRGSKRKYLMYSCDKMKSLGMCVAECGVKNPLTFYKRSLRNLSGGGST